MAVTASVDSSRKPFYYEAFKFTAGPVLGIVRR
jgi:hypothetical protein